MQKGLYSIILPTYNEVENLPLVTYLIDKYLSIENKYNYELIIVDDSSKDGTQEIAKRLIKFYGEKKIRMYTRKGKLGLGTAYFHGFKYAKGEFIIILDADLSHHPKEIPRMIELQKKQNVDFVSGTRYANKGGVYGWNTFRKLTSRGANVMAQTLLKPGVSDLTGSFRLYKREVFEQINKIADEIPKGYAFQMAIAVRLKAMGYKHGEVGIEFVDRLYGESKLSAKEITSYLKGVFKLFFTV